MKEQILEEIIRLKNYKNIDVTQADLLVVIYYIGVLSEINIIETDTCTVSGEGFDLAMDLIESKWKIDIDMMHKCCCVLFGDDTHAILIALILACQEEGIDKVRETYSNAN